MSKKVLITAALLYANGDVHLGHLAGCYLPADAYARFSRLMGKDVLFLSGSDEYGVAITLSAEKKNTTPQQHVDHFHPRNKEFFEKLGISFDYYGRTTNKFHADLTQEFFLKLLAQGYIEKFESMQLYSEHEKRFLPDRYVLGTCPKCGFDEARGDECTQCAASFESTDLINPRSSETDSPLAKRKTLHWYLKLASFKKQLTLWIEEKEWKKNVLNFSLPYIDDLRSRAITRDLSWGVNLPKEDLEGNEISGIKDKVFYVWFDAPIGYISIAKEWAENSNNKDQWKDYWCNELTTLVQFLGKDNIMFHSVLFPAMVMGRNEISKESFKLVDQVAANEFLTLEGKQMSKSSGWFVDLEKFIKTYGTEMLRFHLASSAPEHQDADFSWCDFQSNINGNLIGKFSNFTHRTFSFLYKFSDAIIPSSESDDEFIGKIKVLSEEIYECYSKYQIRKAVEGIMEMAHLANTYFQNATPWKLIKTEEGKKELSSVMFNSLLAAKYLALVSSPIIPKTAETMWSMLGYSEPLERQQWSFVMKEELNVGHKIIEPKVLFEKVEDHQIKSEIETLNAEESPKVEIKKEISFNDFMKLDIRVGKIEAVERVAKSKKLLKLSVSLGFEVRTIVSGIAQFYDESLVGTKVAVLLNLKPRKIMGIESQGMILAAGDDKNLELLVQNNVAEGSEIS